MDFLKARFIMVSPYLPSDSSNGGAIMLQTLRPANITRCRFTLNHASGEGGAIYVGKNSKLRVLDSEFTMNRAMNGGSVAVYMGGSLIQSCSFSFENASEEGGCIHLKAANVTVKQSNLSGCESGNWGGSVNMLQHSTLRLETVIINNSNSTRARDAIYVTSESELFVTKLVLTGSGSELSIAIQCYGTSRMYPGFCVNKLFALQPVGMDVWIASVVL